MDQTPQMSNAMTVTEQKYLQRVQMDSPDSSDIDDDEAPANDALLGGIRTSLSTMTKTAKESLSTCQNKIELHYAIDKIQASSLQLLKLEKSFMKTASIVAEVIDDLASDYEEEEDVSTGSWDETSASEKSEKKKEEKKKPKFKKKPKVFGLGPTTNRTRNAAKLEEFKKKLKSEYNKRMGEYQDGLTEDVLKEDKKFEALMKQMMMGKDAAEISMRQEEEKLIKKREEEGSGDGLSRSFLSSLPWTAKDLEDYPFVPYDEEKEVDYSVLPSIDPISKNPIAYPVKNRFCNHVFDRASIYAFMAGNPNSKCPVHSCRNGKPLDRSDFVTDSILTTHVRRKNNF